MSETGMRGSDASALKERLSRALGPGFDVETLLGQGGFADVYQIRDRQLERHLAAKVLRPEVAWGPWMTSRFEREARALASLQHLNIPPVHFVGENEGLIYYVMPLIRGKSLGDVLSETGPLDPAILVDYMVPVLEALDHAHSAGILHRDIKPDNIIIEEGTGRPLLVDFGVAKHAQPGTAGVSIPGVILGTPGYISPEQALAQDDIDARSDIYAVGATMYHLLTGSPRFPGENTGEIIGNQVTGEPPAAGAMGKDVPAWLAAVIATALSPRREDRFPSAGAMAQALREGRRQRTSAGEILAEPNSQIRENDPTPKMVRAALPSGPWRQRADQRRSVRGRQPARRHPVISSLALLGVLAGTVAAYFALVPVSLVLRNDLVLPIEVSTEDGNVHTIVPGGDLLIGLADDGKILARWFIIQPKSESPRANPGEPISGIIRVEALTAPELFTRRVHRSIASWSEGSLIFAPRVHNATDRAVRVQVNGPDGDPGCNCLLAPGEIRLLGYYRFEPATSVRVELSRRNSQVFRNLESRIDLETGMLDLRVDNTILSRSP